MLCAAAIALSACGVERTYTADPIAARIVDADTGAPVEGVNVVAAWQAKGGLEGGNIMGYVTVMEDVTNTNGEFSFPGWGPKKWRNGAIRDGAPLLILFKPGYDAGMIWERKYGLEFATPHMSSSWSGKAIPLRRFDGSSEEYSQRLFAIRSFVDSLIVERRCDWRSVPLFLTTVDRQHRAFVAAKTTFALSSFEHLEARAHKSCGAVRPQFVEKER